ncbi:vanadium-dependent haloperoxidase [Massilia sp. IC2-477]|uniref:vanadium-dependent haloperoxidase n=1 Tax=Massilia sp. IC2-477 TaxID=2887198 RepID=UPI001D125E9F|nr:vanadium-dependent haloperoxidase [Massilia sp. IC2-477]MCC2957042.1 vanadium-dependent haloperoxidase [Massilia sp. IC2-477]
MTSRIRILLCVLAMPALAAGASPPSSFSAPPPMPVQYLTQPDSKEPPWRYAAPNGANPALRLAYWNELAQRVQGYDHTPPSRPGATSPMPEQMGRTRVSRVFAIVHIAMHDALAAICGQYRPYVGPLPAYPDSSRDAAIAQAAHDTLAALYPRQAARIAAWLRDDLARLPDGRAKLNGIEVGRRAAAAILALRANDGSYQGEPVVGQDYPLHKEPGKWRSDPVSRIPYAVGAWWGRVKPFVIPSASQFRPAPPPALNSSAYTQAFNEVKQLGGDGVRTPTRRTPDQTVTGIFWGYDSVAWLGTPVRMYNQIALQLLLRKTSDPMALARALALVNVAIADATIAGWDAKYHYDVWRPVHGVREASPGSGPTGRGDGNPDTQGDPNWTPLGSPASNLTGPDFTPSFPSYPSGHASLGGALFHTLRRLYGDNQPFSFVSDEFNGVTRDNNGRVRPKISRSYRNLSHAEEEGAQSRIYLGVHWQFDKQAGIAMSHRVADYVVQRGLAPPAR